MIFAYWQNDENKWIVGETPNLCMCLHAGRKSQSLAFKVLVNPN